MKIQINSLKKITHLSDKNNTNNSINEIENKTKIYLKIELKMAD